VSHPRSHPQTDRRSRTLGTPVVEETHTGIEQRQRCMRVCAHVRALPATPVACRQSSIIFRHRSPGGRVSTWSLWSIVRTCGFVGLWIERGVHAQACGPRHVAHP
jgi:hypothetical protein